MNLWGDFHRLIAARLTELGANIQEIEVNHRERKKWKIKVWIFKNFQCFN